MSRTKYLALPGYSVAFLLFLVPLFDTALTVFPWRFGESSWRFGVVGVFSRALLTPLLGLLIAFAVAVLLDHRAVQRAISVFSGLIAVAVMCILALFVLDALQMRVQVRPEAKTAFDVTSVMALGKYGLAMLVLAAFTVGGWKSSRRENSAAARAGRQKSEDAGIIVASRAPI